MKYLIALSTLLLCAVTLASTVLFWSSMPTDLFGKVLAGVTATALECCKYSFFPAGVYYLRKKNIGGLVMLVMGVVLLVISVCATSGFLENAYSQQTTNAQRSSVEHQTKQQQLNSIQQQIDSLNLMIAADAKQEYRTRAYKYASQVEELEQKRNSALQELQSTQETAHGNAQALFVALGNTLHSSPEVMRQCAFIALALVVDICAVISLMALGGFRAAAPIETTRINTKPMLQSTESAAQTVKTNFPEKPTPAPTKPLSNKEQEVLAKVVAGVFGNSPQIRAIISGEKIAHKSVARIFENLVERNLAKREGSKYFLVQHVIS